MRMLLGFNLVQLFHPFQTQNKGEMSCTSENTLSLLHPNFANCTMWRPCGFCGCYSAYIGPVRSGPIPQSARAIYCWSFGAHCSSGTLSQYLSSSSSSDIVIIINKSVANIDKRHSDLDDHSRIWSRSQASHP